MKRLDMKKFEEMMPCEDGYKFVLGLGTTDLKKIFEALEKGFSLVKLAHN